MIPQKSKQNKKIDQRLPNKLCAVKCLVFKAYCAIIFNFSIFLIMASLCTDLANVSALLMCK